MQKRVRRYYKPHRLDLLTEIHSRISDGGGMLDEANLPDDELIRVILETRYIPVHDIEGISEDDLRRHYVCELDRDDINICEIPGEIRLCIEAACSLCGDEDICWCFGEAPDYQIDRIVPLLGDRLKTAHSFRNSYYFMFNINMHEAKIQKHWPGLNNDLSAHIFIFRNLVGNMAANLDSLCNDFHFNHDGTIHALKSIQDRCVIRIEISELSKEMLLMIHPAGEHFQNPAIHTSSFTLYQIVKAFSEVASSHRYEFNPVENVGHTYRTFL